MQEDLFKANTSVPVALFVSDLHWRRDPPEYRKEKGDFSKVIEKKLSEVFACSVAAETTLPIFFTGDLFNGARDFLQFWSFMENVEHWKKKGKELSLYSVRGQHDMRYHSEKNLATSFNLLVKGGWLKEIKGERGLYLDNNIDVYGCGWNEPYPVPVDKSANNVLVLHKTMWHKTPIYPGQGAKGNVSVESVKLVELGYRTVFCGDNHKSFDVKVGGVQFYNLGAFTRNSTDLAKQQPRFCLLKSDMSVDSIYVGEKDVFEIDRSIGDKLHQNAKDEFSVALAGGFQYGDTFEGALKRVLDERKCGDIVLNTKQHDILNDVFGEI